MSGGVESEVKKQRSWPMVRLGDVCDFYRGLTYKKTDEVSLSDKIVLRSNNVSLESGTLDFTELKFLRSDFSIPTEKMVKRDSILMCMANGSKIHLGKVALVTEDFGYAFGGFMGLLVPKGVAPKYLYLSLLSERFKDLIKELQNGANINNLKFADISDFEIPLPPVSVQKEIVERLEKELGEADKVAANFKKMVELADAEFKAELDETFKALENGEGEFLTQRYRGAEVQRVRLGEVCEIKTGKKDVNQGNVNGKYPFFTCARTPTRSDTYSFDCAALLIAGNGDVGYTQKYTGKFEAYQRTYVLSDFQNILLDYLYYALAALLKEHAGVNKKGSSMPYIKMGTLREFMFSYPSLEVQRTIVAKLDSAKERCEKLKGAAERGLKAAENLRKAILAEAFE